MLGTWARCLPIGEAVPPLCTPQEPLSQVSLWSGNFLSFQVLEKVLFLSAGRCTDGPLPQGCGDPVRRRHPEGDLLFGRGTEGKQGGGKWKK